MSGAGKSTALKTLEDMGYEAVDNLPRRVLPLLLRDKDTHGPMVLGVDVRSRNFDTDFFIQTVIPALKKKDPSAQVLFLDAEDEVLRRRFSETRRKHPLAQDRQVRDGILQEREILANLKKHADLVMDSSEFSIPDLRRWLKLHYGTKEEQMLLQLLPRYVDEGKSYLTIAIGCTGGKHRSVAVAEDLAKFLKSKSFKISLMHRDISL